MKVPARDNEIVAFRIIGVADPLVLRPSCLGVGVGQCRGQGGRSEAGVRFEVKHMVKVRLKVGLRFMHERGSGRVRIRLPPSLTLGSSALPYGFRLLETLGSGMIVVNPSSACG